MKKIALLGGCLMMAGCTTAPMKLDPTQQLAAGEKVVVGRFNFNFGSDARPVLMCMDGVTMCKQLDGPDGSKEYFVRKMAAGEVLQFTAFNRAPKGGGDNFGEVTLFENFVVDVDPKADVTYIGDVSYKLSPSGEPSFRVFSSEDSVRFLKEKYAAAGKPFDLTVAEKRVDPRKVGEIKVITNSLCAGKLLCRPVKFQAKDIKVEQ